MQYGVRTKDGYVHHEKFWVSVDLLFKGSHGFGMKHIADWGVLVCREDESQDWREVEL